VARSRTGNHGGFGDIPDYREAPLARARAPRPGKPAAQDGNVRPPQQSLACRMQGVSLMDLGLRGRRALITDASKGIGFA
jgi:hypothetical protein